MNLRPRKSTKVQNPNYKIRPGELSPRYHLLGLFSRDTRHHLSAGRLGGPSASAEALIDGGSGVNGPSFATRSLSRDQHKSGDSWEPSYGNRASGSNVVCQSIINPPISVWGTERTAPSLLVYLSRGPPLGWVWACIEGRGNQSFETSCVEQVEVA